MGAIEMEYGSMLLNFDEPSAVFYSGQVLSGRIMLNLDKPLRFKAINILYSGKASVSWSDYESEEYNGQSYNTQVKYQGNQDYFQQVQCLSGGEGIWELATGNYTIPFKYHIPHTAPSSYESKQGEVEYYVIAYINYPDGNKKNDEVMKKFQVVAPLDLNRGNPALWDPIELEFEEVLGCGCFDVGPLLAKVRLPVSGYCPGQKIPISVKVDNRSAFEVNSFIFEIYTKNRYVSQQPQSELITGETVLASTIRGPILSSTEKEFVCDLQVPNIIAINLENCSIIDLGYFFKVTIKLSGCNNDVSDDREICLGLVPLASTVNGQYIHPKKDELPMSPIPDPNQPIQNIILPPFPAKMIKSGVNLPPSAPPLESDQPVTSPNMINVNLPGFNMNMSFPEDIFNMADLNVANYEVNAGNNKIHIKKTVNVVKNFEMNT